jgi:hypothetical protein
METAAMIGVNEVALVPGDMNHNYVAVLIASHILPDDEVLPGDISVAESDLGKKITGFTIVVGDSEQRTELKEGGFELAALLYYLAEKHGQDTFDIGESDREFISTFFGAELVHEALTNSHTDHTTIRDLLALDSVRVTIHRRRRF